MGLTRQLEGRGGFLNLKFSQLQSDIHSTMTSTDIYNEQLTFIFQNIKN